MARKDSRKSWLVLGAVTFSIFLETGIIKGFSVLLPTLKEQFVTETWVVGSSIAIMTAFGYLVGLSSDVLVKTLKPRVCVMLSGLFASIGLIICSSATSSLMLLCGLTLAGFLLLQENILVGVIPDYFDQYFTTAVCVYTCGAGLGITILPILTQFLQHVYGWRGAVLLLSVISFHSILCGALLTPDRTVEEDPQLLLIHKETDIDNRVNLKMSLLQQAFKTLGLQLLTDISYISKVLVPGFVLGYTLIGWMIYIVYFAVSRGASIKEASIVSSCGGIGVIIIRATMPFILRKMTYKQLLYLSSITLAISLSVTNVLQQFTEMCVFSFMYGLSVGALGGSIYISAKVNSKESEHHHAISLMHGAYGGASILSGYVTGVLFDATGSFALSFNILAGVSLITAFSLGIGDIFEAKNR